MEGMFCYVCNKEFDIIDTSRTIIKDGRKVREVRAITSCCGKVINFGDIKGNK